MSAIGLLIHPLVMSFLLLAERCRSEYPTANAISAVTRHVQKHQGQWPTTWDDLSFPPDLRHQVNIRFDVTSRQILANRRLIHEVITPVTGPFRIYPHSKDDLDHLLSQLIIFNALDDDAHPPTTDAGASGRRVR